VQGLPFEAGMIDVVVQVCCGWWCPKIIWWGVSDGVPLECPLCVPVPVVVSIQITGGVVVFVFRRTRPTSTQVKAHLRKAAETTIPRLVRRIGRIVAVFPARECRNFFRHAGYVQT
jgi:hypothetical protein